MSIRNLLVGLTLMSVIAASAAAPPAPMYSITLLPTNVLGASGIDNKGQVAITYQDPFLSHAGLWDGESIIDLGDLGGGISGASDISQNGKYVSGSGETASPFFDPHAFIATTDTITDLGTLGGRRSLAYAVNTSGGAVGISDTAGGESHGFLYSKGIMQDLGTLGGPASSAFDINNAGVIVGSSFLTQEIEHAFVYVQGKMVDLGTLEGGTRSSAHAINNAGVIAGISNGTGFEDSPHVFIYRNGVMTDIGTLGGEPVTVTDINSGGEVVGQSGLVGYLYTNGQMLDLNSLIDPSLGWRVRFAFGINDRGQIVVALDSDEELGRIAVLTPIGGARAREAQFMQQRPAE